MLFERKQFSQSSLIRSIRNIEATGKSATISLIAKNADVSYSKAYCAVVEAVKSQACKIVSSTVRENVHG